MVCVGQVGGYPSLPKESYALVGVDDYPDNPCTPLLVVSSPPCIQHRLREGSVSRRKINFHPKSNATASSDLDTRGFTHCSSRHPKMAAEHGHDNSLSSIGYRLVSSLRRSPPSPPRLGRKHTTAVHGAGITCPTVAGAAAVC